MKTFVSVGIGLVVGIVIGVAASFKAAMMEAEDKITKTLAEERKAMREANGVTTETKKQEETTNKNEPTPFDPHKDFLEDKNVKEEYEEVTAAYKPMVKKPYILEDAEEDDADFVAKHPYLDEFVEIEIVYDRDRGMVADDDGFEYAESEIRSRLGWNNLNKLFTDDRFPRAEGMHIVDEQNHFIYLCHAGDITDFVEDYVDDDED